MLVPIDPQLGRETIDMTVIAHRPRGRDLADEPNRWRAVLRAVVTILLVTAVVAAALGAATYVASRAFIAMLS
jgi:hypothetical protein